MKIFTFKHFGNKGFTLLELLVATTIIGILALVVSGFYVDRMVDSARNTTLLILQSNTKQALESMQRDIKSAQDILVTNQWPDPNGPGQMPRSPGNECSLPPVQQRKGL